MVTAADVWKAREEVYGLIHVTPVLTSSLLNDRCGSSIFLKAEHLQKTGSFKIRGAANKVKQAAREGVKSVTAASSGNHGQAVAYIAREFGLPAVIVVPEDANPAKVAAIEAYGARVENCGTTSAERISRAEELARETGGTYIPPYDDPFVMAGQGTCGLELIEQVPDVETIIVPVGGGGLISGILAAIKETKPTVKVIGVEPESANDTFLSLQAGRIMSIASTATIADGLRTSQPGELTFPVLQKYVDDLILVSEQDIKEAFKLLAERTKQIVEPSGATALAAVVSGQMRGGKVGVVLSGGNVDLHNVAAYLP